MNDRRLVVASAVRKTFGTGRRTVVALDGVDAVIAVGDRIAVTGRSGSGKSTLVHLLAGLETPSAGEVVWPQWPGSVPPHPTSSVGVVFQGPSLLPPLTVVENVALPLVLSAVGPEEAATLARDALSTVGIDDLANKLPEELSGGQAQRVAVARVLASGPALIIADEPTGQLDREAADHVIDVLLHAADRLGAALVMATHDAHVADRMETRWEMADGSLTCTAAVVPGSRS